MKTAIKRLPILAFGAAMLAVLAGCSSVSQGVSDAGTARTVVFPDMEKAWMKEGIFPNVDNVRTVRSGVTKDQLYSLLGRPHFSEGLGSVREWDYIFHFRKPDGSVATCQYKVIFNKDYKAGDIFWKPAACSENFMAAAAAAAAAPVAARAPEVTLDADALFAFDKSGPQDILPEGRRQLDELPARLNSTFKRLDGMIVIGHTDRLGDKHYNQRLSMARASTVRDYLVARGLPKAAVRAAGAGDTQPLVQCDDGPDREALIHCLQPNRRVEIEVRGER